MTGTMCRCGCGTPLDPKKRQTAFASMACRGRFYGRQRSTEQLRSMGAKSKGGWPKGKPRRDSGRHVGLTGLL